jgi:hypothetical protein
MRRPVDVKAHFCFLLSMRLFPFNQAASVAILPSALWWIMLLSCIAIAVYATRYFLSPRDDNHFSRYVVPLRLHIAGGMGALLAGPWQFYERLRMRAMNLHRWASDCLPPIRSLVARRIAASLRLIVPGANPLDSRCMRYRVTTALLNPRRGSEQYQAMNSTIACS